MKSFYSVIITLVFAVAANAAHAAGVTKITCTSTKKLSTQRNVLYKDSNVHGGRGRTFLDQDHQFGSAQKLFVAGTNGTVIGCFGLYACDRPFGCRYYQAMCHDSQSKAQVSSKARKNGGSNNVLVSNRAKGKCFTFNIASARVGSVRK